MEQDSLFDEPCRKQIIRVVPEGKWERCLDYAVPDSLEGKIKLGHRVRVPLGSREQLAYVVAFPDGAEVSSVRDIRGVVEVDPAIPPVLIRLARWMAGYYCCELTQVLKSMLPELLRKREQGFKEQLWVQPLVNRLEEAKLRPGARLQVRAMEGILRQGGGWMTILCRDTGATPATWRSLAKRGLVRLESRARARNPFAGTALSEDPRHALSTEQQEAVDCILAECDASAPRPVLLQGVTGSGKTEVYLRVMEQVLARGCSALVLVPEIALTPQTVERFRARFEKMGMEVAVLHSHLSPGERHDQWHRIRSGAARIVIGARSAVFAPLTRTGLIIVDEEHEQSFKQEETPRYHARDLAVYRACLERVPVVLGSATPSLETVANARRGKYLQCRLRHRHEQHRLPVIHVVDLRREKRGGPQAHLISPPLQQALHERLDLGEQAILFLNRRGFATSLQCPQCGTTCECPACSVPMTYHRADGELRCHLCDHFEEVPEACPHCAFAPFKQAGSGTQRIESAVSELFPKARFQRVDSDTMRNKHAYEQLLAAFREGELDFLIGTQMIAKGLDFPRVTCVGIIGVDSALQLPDFRAAERVFQQLVQVAGRAGRGQREGEVFLQTFAPFHPAIQFARHHDVDGFLDHELEFRLAQKFPPYGRCALIGIRGRDREKTAFCARQVRDLLKPVIPAEEMTGEPVPAPIEKIRHQYRYQIVFFSEDMARLSRKIGQVLRDQKWPDDVVVTVDIDAYSLL